MVGAGTLRTERYGRLVRDPHRREQRVAAGLDADPLAIVVSGRLALSCDLPLLADAASRVVVVTASDAIARGCAAAGRLPALVAGRPRGRARARCAAEHGVRSILCEGGPSLNASLLAAGLIDELFLTTVGKLAGGAGALTIVGDAPLARAARRAAASGCWSATASCSRATPSAIAAARRARRTIGCMEERDPLDGIGAADAHLGRAVPLPADGAAARALGRGRRERAAGRPGRVEPRRDAAGHAGPPDALRGRRRRRPSAGCRSPTPHGRYAHRSAPLEEAEPELRPVHELAWEQDGLHLRLTGQGPWTLEQLVALADSTRPMRRLTRNELIAVLGGLLLAGGLFAPWYDAVSRAGLDRRLRRHRRPQRAGRCTRSCAGSCCCSRSRRSCSPTSSPATTSCRGCAAR